MHVYMYVRIYVFWGHAWFQVKVSPMALFVEMTFSHFFHGLHHTDFSFPVHIYVCICYSWLCIQESLLACLSKLYVVVGDQAVLIKGLAVDKADTLPMYYLFGSDHFLKTHVPNLKIIKETQSIVKTKMIVSLGFLQYLLSARDYFNCFSFFISFLHVIFKYLSHDSHDEALAMCCYYLQFAGRVINSVAQGNTLNVRIGTEVEAFLVDGKSTVSLSNSILIIKCNYLEKIK